MTSQGDDPPDTLLPYIDFYWKLQSNKCRDVYVPRILCEEMLQAWECRGSTGVSLLWHDATVHGFSLQQAKDGVYAALSRRGKRYRVAVTDAADGVSFWVTKLAGLRPPPSAIRKELQELTSLQRDMPDIQSAIAVRNMRESIRQRLSQPLEYSRPGRRRKNSQYDFQNWDTGEWRVFPASCTAVNIRGALESHCAVRGINGHIEIMMLTDGKLAVLRTGQKERPYPAPKGEPVAVQEQ